MTNWQRGDIVLVKFVFADERGAKYRPVVILSAPQYQTRRQELIVAAVTSNVRRILPGDYRLQRWEAAGLIGPSVVTGIIRTIKRSMIANAIGALNPADLKAYDQKLRTILDL